LSSKSCTFTSRSACCAVSAWTAEIDDSKRLVSEIAAWERQRNAAAARIKWMFTTAKARAKMGRAYPDTFKEFIITVQRY
jgi:hypothetical protein